MLDYCLLDQAMYLLLKLGSATSRRWNFPTYSPNYSPTYSPTYSSTDTTMITAQSRSRDGFNLDPLIRALRGLLLEEHDLDVGSESVEFGECEERIRGNIIIDGITVHVDSFTVDVSEGDALVSDPWVWEGCMLSVLALVVERQ